MKNVRNTNIEFLRIILMLMIIVGHISIYSGKLGSIGTVEFYLTNGIRSFCMVACNCFIIIAGYFGIKLNIQKLIYLDVKIILITWVIFGVAVGVGIHEINVIRDIQLLMPILTKQYWFMTDYFVLCLLSPFINFFIDSIDEGTLKKFLLVGFIIFYVLATFCFIINAGQIVLDAGYGIVNFVYLYMVGGYLQKYYSFKRTSARYLLYYCLCCVLLFLCNFSMTKIMGFYFDSMISYNTVFNVLGAIFLFLAFKELSVKESRWINYIAASCMSVYVIHMHPSITAYIFNELFQVDEHFGIRLVGDLLLLPVITYFGCAFIDKIIEFLLNIVRKTSKNVHKKFLK